MRRITKGPVGAGVIATVWDSISILVSCYFEGELPRVERVSVNRIYRLVWNAQVGMWVVASETAKARGKRGGLRRMSGAAMAAKIAAAGTVVIQAMLAPTHVFAQYANTGSTATGTGSVAIGGGSGYAASASSNNSVAIGQGSKANSQKSGASTNTGAVAIGANSKATTTTGGGPVAIGTSASAVVTGTTGASPVAIGTTANANGTGSQVAIGDQALASGQDAIAIGGHANSAGVQATGAESTAIGQSSVATNTGSVALGYMSSSTGVGSVALGGNGVDGALAGGANAFAVGAGASAVADNTIALGGGAFANAVNGIAIGASASVTGNTSVAIGANSMVSGAGGVALGSGASAGNANDVALGSNSTTAAPSAGPYSVNGGSIAGTSDTSGVVSVGAPGAERQIQNVAAGTVSAASTDAINGSQLYAAGSAANNLGSSTASNLGGGATYDSTTGTVSAPSYTVNGKTYNNVDAALSASTTHYYSVNDGGTQGGNYTNDGATGLNALAAGVGASAANAGGVALGDRAIATNANDVALGANSVTGTANPTAGDTINGTTYRYAGTNPASVVSVGSAGNERQITNVAAGQVSASSTDAVNGSQLYAAGQAIDSLSDSVVKYDTNLDGSVNYSSVTLNPGGSSVKITNVAAGDVSSTSTDAVNGSQLYATNRNVEQNTTALSSIQNGQAGPFVSDNSQTATQPLSSGANAAAGGFGATATGDNSLVVGNDAADNGNANATVLGEGASIASNVAGSNVALGQGSAVTTAAIPVTGTTINGAEYSFAGANPAGVVSVGSAGAARQITNVAAGQIGATSTDAVNGSQLYATNQALSALDTAVNNLGSTVSQALGANPGDTNAGGGTGTGADGSVGNSGSNGNSGTAGSPSYVINGQTFNNVGAALTAAGSRYYGVNDGGEQRGNYSNDGATGSNSVAVGVNTVSSGTNSTAVGNSAAASGAGSTALGNGAVASGTNSVALGANSVASAPNTVSVGAPGSERTVSNVAPGVNGTDAANVNQLGAVAMQSTQQFNSLREGMSSLRNDMYGATAAAMAVAGLPQPTGPGKSMLSVAGSTFQGQQGMAVGLSTVTENGKWVIKGAMATNTRNEVGAVLSAGYQW